MKKKEIYWFAGTFLLSLVIHSSMNGFDMFTSDAALDINIHDTYYVFRHSTFFLFLLIFVFFGVYLVRMLGAGFKNLTTNLVFILSSSGVLLILYSLISLMNTLKETQALSEAEYSGLKSILTVSQIALLFLMIFSGFKTWMNYKRNI